MGTEFARMGIVYGHLIACCVAIGLVLTSDLVVIKHLITGNADEMLSADHLEGLQKTVSLALLGLWITGAALVTLDAGAKGWGILNNPKLQSKIAVVALLTLNGQLLHLYVLPVMRTSGSLLNMTFGQRNLAIFAGSVSGVSWFYAAMLGIARPLNWNYSVFEILAAYPLLISGSFVFMALLTNWSQRKANARH